MRDHAAENSLHAIEVIFAALGETGIAVSGGVDSMTLATVAGRMNERRVTMFHAVSHAVPREATERVIAYGQKERWRLRVIDAGEFSNETYLQNPVNRCFHCKHQLYSSISGIFNGVVLSGTNTDDLCDFRPGLDAARAFGVRHPYVEAGVDKAGIRQIAALLGMVDICNLPASPCLSSRIETGIPISKERLRVIEDCELLLREMLAPSIIRCRIRNGGIGIELDETALSKLTPEMRVVLKRDIERIAEGYGVAIPSIAYGPYRRGSAFLVRADVMPTDHV